MRLKELLNKAVAFTAAGDPMRHYWVGAIAIRDDGTVVMARNLPTKTKNPHVHAEALLVKKLGLNPSLVLVVRVNRDGQLVMAKPCPRCESILRAHRARKILFTTSDGIESLV